MPPKPKTSTSQSPPTNVTRLSTQEIQLYLEENKSLIEGMMDFQESGMTAHYNACEERLQQNLTFLAGVADAQAKETEPGTAEASPQTAGQLLQQMQADLPLSGSLGPSSSIQPNEQRQFQEPASKKQKQKSPALQQQQQHQSQASSQATGQLKQHVKQFQAAKSFIELSGPNSPAFQPVQQQQQQQHQFQASTQAAGQVEQHVQPHQAAALSRQQSSNLDPYLYFPPDVQGQQQQHQFQEPPQAAGQVEQHMQPYQPSNLDPYLYLPPDVQRQQQQHHQFQAPPQAAGQLEQQVQPHQAAASSRQQLNPVDPYLYFPPDDQEEQQRRIQAFLQDEELVEQHNRPFRAVAALDRQQADRQQAGSVDSYVYVRRNIKEPPIIQQQQHQLIGRQQYQQQQQLPLLQQQQPQQVAEGQLPLLQQQQPQQLAEGQLPLLQQQQPQQLAEGQAGMMPISPPFSTPSDDTNQRMALQFADDVLNSDGNDKQDD